MRPRRNKPVNVHTGRRQADSKGRVIDRHQGMDPRAPSLTASWQAAAGAPQQRAGTKPALFESLGQSDGPYCQGAKNAFVVSAPLGGQPQELAAGTRMALALFPPSPPCARHSVGNLSPSACCPSTRAGPQGGRLGACHGRVNPPRCCGGAPAPAGGRAGVQRQRGARCRPAGCQLVATAGACTGGSEGRLRSSHLPTVPLPGGRRSTRPCPFPAPQVEVLQALAGGGAVTVRRFSFEAYDINITALLCGQDVAWGVACR